MDGLDLPMKMETRQEIIKFKMSFSLSDYLPFKE
jgi:hypothetical protein